MKTRTGNPKQKCDKCGFEYIFYDLEKEKICQNCGNLVKLKQTMKYKQINQTREFEFSNGMIGEIDGRDIKIYENKDDNKALIYVDLDEAKQIHEVLGDLLGEACEN